MTRSKMMLGEFFERLLAVAHGGDPVVLTLEIGGHGVTDGLFVFDEQDTAGFVAHKHSSNYSGRSPSLARRTYRTRFKPCLASIVIRVHAHGLRLL